MSRIQRFLAERLPTTAERTSSCNRRATVTAGPHGTAPAGEDPPRLPVTAPPFPRSQTSSARPSAGWDRSRTVEAPAAVRT
ncbi:hypothetical protein [Streptomyces sp. NPDC051572]|uniref:hypothetical protein n=1 Tax=Streptomyces sp. NPDC051572 TaxID=3155802 RepID=UPI00344FAB00